MERKYYICEYCQEEYLPKRRNHQKYCCSSCRSKAYHIRQRDKDNTTTNEVENILVSESPTTTVVDDDDSNNSFSTEVATISNEKNQKTKIEAMSLAGFGNAAAGTLAAGMVKDFFTKEENKPVTKKDLLAIRQRMARYYKVNNLPKKIDQTTPIFDIHTGNIEYVTKIRALYLLDPQRNF